MIQIYEAGGDEMLRRMNQMVIAIAQMRRDEYGRRIVLDDRC
jgi:hypothetical protein